jgi:hypothetical protein
MTVLLKNDQQLIDYSIYTLQSLDKLASFFSQKFQTSYRNPIGAHIRHIIEHFEVLILSQGPLINYDLRQRDELLEESPQEVKRRILILCNQLEEIDSNKLKQSVEVISLGGMHGESVFSNQSSFGRELCFLNSHAIHHLAIIKPFCLELKIPLDDYFGYAPSTIAYLESQKMEAL